MKLKLASIDDLPQIITMYKEIINNMRRNDILIWDDIYPCEFFKEDIQNSRLHVLYKNHDEPVAAFALCESINGMSAVNWNHANDKTLYLERFGVNVEYSRQGIGNIMLKHAITLTKQKNANCLRLFVASVNKPAIALYVKSGFRQVEGIYEESIDNQHVLREYGFEVEV